MDIPDRFQLAELRNTIDPFPQIAVRDWRHGCLSNTQGVFLLKLAALLANGERNTRSTARPSRNQNKPRSALTGMNGGFQMAHNDANPIPTAAAIGVACCRSRRLDSVCAASRQYCSYPLGAGSIPRIR